MAHFASRASTQTGSPALHPGQPWRRNWSCQCRHSQHANEPAVVVHDPVVDRRTFADTTDKADRGSLAVVRAPPGGVHVTVVAVGADPYSMRGLESGAWRTIAD